MRLRPHSRQRAVISAVFTFLLAMSFALSGKTSTTAAPKVNPAIDGVLALFQRKSVVVLCDHHGMAQEEDYYSALVGDPRFADTVGNLVVEFGGESSQGIIDGYVAGEDVPVNELRRVWTETVGWVPGPTEIGYINVFAAVRAANLHLPRERRIKVWLGEPKIDWSKINSFADLQPYFAQRDDNYVRIIRDEILAKKKKALLIIGTGHIFGNAAALPMKVAEAHLEAPATVVAFTGYVEPECNGKFAARAKDWPVPATITPLEGGSLKSVVELPGCTFVRADRVARIKATPPAKFPPGVSSSEEMLRRFRSMVSGEDADAILYLGPPDALTESPYDPAIYLDSEYFKEEDRRLRCCLPPELHGNLDLDSLLNANTVAPHKLQ